MSAKLIPESGIDWTKTCKGCGQCCGCYPLPIELILRYADRIEVDYGLFPVDSIYVLPTTRDNMCPFLSRFDKRCSIYVERPEICRWYGEIPELPCGKLYPEAAQMSFEEMVPRVAKRLGINLDDDS